MFSSPSPCLARTLRVGRSAPASLFVAFLLGCLAPAAQAGQLFSSGHGDLGVTFDGTDLALEFHGHTGAVIDGQSLEDDTEFEPGDIEILVNQSILVTPSLSSFLNIPVGDRVYFLSPTELVDSPFLGLASEELDPNQWSGDLVWTISGVTGPGTFLLAALDSFGKPLYTAGANESFSLEVGGHNHFLFSFSAPGTNEITFSAQGSLLVDGGPGTELRSGSGTFGFVVPVPEPSLLLSAGSLILCASAVHLRRVRLPGRHSRPIA